MDYRIQRSGNHLDDEVDGLGVVSTFVEVVEGAAFSVALTSWGVSTFVRPKVAKAAYSSGRVRQKLPAPIDSAFSLAANVRVGLLVPCSLSLL